MLYLDLGLLTMTRIDDSIARQRHELLDNTLDEELTIATHIPAPELSEVRTSYRTVEQHIAGENHLGIGDVEAEAMERMTRTIEDMDIIRTKSQHLSLMQPVANDHLRQVESESKIRSLAIGRTQQLLLLRTAIEEAIFVRAYYIIKAHDMIKVTMGHQRHDEMQVLSLDDLLHLLPFLLKLESGIDEHGIACLGVIDEIVVDLKIVDGLCNDLKHGQRE